MTFDKKVGIIQTDYISYDESLNFPIQHRDLRVIDNFSKMALILSNRLLEKVKANEIADELKCVVLATDTGPKEALRELCSGLRSDGFRSINPSKFPNVMLSTPLSRIGIEYKIKGPSTAIYINGRLSQALQYGMIQIGKGVCVASLILYVNDGKGCLGIFLEEKTSAIKRGQRVRFGFDLTHKS